MRTKFNARTILLVVGLLILGATIWASHANAQILYGSIVGTVKDPSGAAVPQATVRITNEETGVARQMKTDSHGGYSFPTVPAGTYDVTVSKQGFKGYTFKGADVEIDQTARVDASLQLGAISQSVEVTSQTPMLQTESAQVRGNINSTALQSIPIPIDSNYESLLITVPGITPPDNAHSYAANPSRGLIFDVNGTTAQSNDVRIDGVGANNLWLPHVTAYVPSRHAIEAVSVVTNSFNVSQGVVGGAAVNVHIRSGTNHMHGSLYEGNMNNGLEADPFAFVPLPPGLRKPKLIDNDFGGTVGGPIVKNKLFYFGSYEGIMLRELGERLVTLPTAAMRGGDFSASPTLLYDPATSSNPDGSGRIPFVASSDPTSPDYNPACTNAAGCPNIIPTNRLDPTALQVQKLLVPMTNQPGLTNNYFASGPFKSDRHTVDTKMDWNINDKLRVNGRLSLLHFNMIDAPVLGNNGIPVASFGGRTEHGFGNIYNLTFSGSYTTTSNFVIDGYFGVLLMNQSSEPHDLNVMEGLETLNLPGTNGPTTEYGGWPVFNITDYTPLGNGSGGSNAVYYKDRTYVWSGDANWIKGSHMFMFGGQIIRGSMNHFEFGNTTGTFTFNGGVTTLNAPGAPSTNQFNTYASFLLGLPSSVAKGFNPFNNGRELLHMWQYSAFAQDQWKVRSNLTLNYGVSWNYFPFGSRSDRGLERYLLDSNQVMLCGVGGNPMNCGYNISKKNFSPALGIAYRVTPTFVIRAGAGFTYDPEPLAYIRDMIGNYPENLDLAVNAPNSRSAEGALAAGIPAITVPDISSGLVTLPPGYGIHTLTSDYHRDYVESWNFTLEKRLKAGWVAQAGYVATRQVKVPGLLNLNVGQVGGGTASERFNILYGNTNAIDLETPVNHIHYDSLQSQLSHRFASGYQLQISYTWSKTIGDCCNRLADGGPAIHLPQYFDLNRSILSWDRTHDFVVSMVANLPFGSGKRWLKNGGWSSRLAGGWQANALFSAFSGNPFNISASGTSLDAPGNSQRADLIGSGPVTILGGIGPGQTYFDTSRFARVTEVRFGTAGFNILRAPGAANLDFSLFRKFRITERFNLQFRAEAFNVTNTPHFSSPNGNANSGSFGQVTSTHAVGREGIDQRIFRLGMQLNF